MKTKLFSEGFPNKDFVKDIETLCQMDISPEQLRVLSKSASDWTLATTGPDQTKALEALRKVWPLDMKNLETAVNVTGFFLNKIDVNDNAEDIISDIKELDLVGTKEIEKFRPFVNVLLTEIKTRFAVENMVGKTERAAVKIVQGITCAVDLRPVVMNQFKNTENATDYKPQINSLVPIVIIRLRLTDDETCIFQMDRQTVRRFKEQLGATGKILDAVIGFVGPDKIHKSDTY